MKKKKGSIELFVSSMILVVVPLIIIMQLRLGQLRTTKNQVEDSLVASNLASATVDLKEYGTTNRIVNNDFNSAFNTFIKSLKQNLLLDNNLEQTDKKIISSKINIDNFTIYNVVGNDVQFTTRDSSGNISSSIISNGKDRAKTPDGAIINSTTVYSKISFKVKGYLNTEYNVFKEKSVDITDK